ncbi:MAG: hypothetical protein HFH39_04055 [Lachnospiraceae bacterium]|nr:hypothetical protein [Lachnospiraceae bacterium]
MDKTNELLTKEIEREIKNLSALENGSKEQSEAVESLAKLYRLKIEEMKNVSELEEKREARISEEQLKRDLSKQELDQKYDSLDSEESMKKDQLAEQVKDRYFKFGMEAVSLILPLLFYRSWMKKGFRFEETGTFTSATFRGLFSRFKPTKK